MNPKSEEQHQMALFSWVNQNLNIYPELSLLFAIPNGGLRNKIIAMKLRATGVRAGVPDLFLPIAKNGYHGLFIELKKPEAKLKKPKIADDGYLRIGGETDNQIKWAMKLQGQGYKVCFCYGWEEARDLILRYLGGENVLIGLHDAEKDHMPNKTFPNLSLMKISAYHKKQGDTVSWWMPLQTYDVVYFSKIFDFTTCAVKPPPLGVGSVK